MSKPKIGLIREGKFPPDFRVALTPLQCKSLIENGWDIVIQKSNVRCFTDEEFVNAGIPLVEDVKNCDVLIGIKEVPVDLLIPSKTYLFFSHTMKKQAHNRKLLQTVMEKKIRLIDYELITDDQNERLIAFGYFAGIVGAHMALYTYSKRTGLFELKHMNQFPHYDDAVKRYKEINWPPIKIVLTGTGRVGSGAAKVLNDMGFVRMAPADFLNSTNEKACYTQLSAVDYVSSKDHKAFTKQDYYKMPQNFDMDFKKYLAVSDIFINGIYWDNKSPAFFALEQMKNENFKVEVIADVTCDIAPDSSIPCTLKPSTIDDPVFGFDKNTLEIVEPYHRNTVDIMAIDNLPNALPRDSSEAFGEKLIKYILPELEKEHSDILDRGTITQNGVLSPKYRYLQDYVDDHSS